MEWRGVQKFWGVMEIVYILVVAWAYICQTPMNSTLKMGAF